MKVIVAEKISASAIDLLHEPRWTVVTPDQIDGNLASQLESADALIVRSAVQVNADLLSNAKKLRVIGRAGVGVDNIDLEAATRKGIAVMNTPGANAVAVAEQTFAMTLAIVGLGRIGMEVARRARAFGMEVVGHDPFVSLAVAKEQGIRMASLDDL